MVGKERSGGLPDSARPAAADSCGSTSARAAGVGKTFAMLGEGHRRHERGADVVVAFVETHGRPAHRRADRRPGDDPPRADGLPRHDVRGDGYRRRAGPQARDRAGRRVRAHQRARLAQREALAGRRGAAGRRHRRDLHRQHPAPGVAQRRRREDHRRAPAGDRARRGGAGRRPGRAGRHDRRRRCAAGWRTATSTRPRRSTRR